MTVSNRLYLPDGAPTPSYQLYLPDGVPTPSYRLFLNDCVAQTCQTPNEFPSPDDFTTWTVAGNASVTPNVSLSPECVQNADRLTLSEPEICGISYNLTGLTGGNIPTFSIWVKKVSAQAGSRLVMGNANDLSEGYWRIDMNHASWDSGDWQKIEPGHPALTVVNDFFVSNVFFTVLIESEVAIATVDLWCSYFVEN